MTEEGLQRALAKNVPPWNQALTAAISADLEDLRQTVPRSAVRERLREGWSQAEIAQRMTTLLGVKWHQTTVAKTESGERPLKIHEFMALCLALGSSPLELMRGSSVWETIHQEGIRRRQLIADRATQAALALLEHLPEDARAEYKTQLADIDQDFSQVREALEVAGSIVDLTADAQTLMSPTVSPEQRASAQRRLRKAEEGQ